ncbi:MAG TPA: hypothetical protein VHT68_22270 [Pseudolabrys sp.]|nr:hypothetical protein [Pseudolabrys sp.]
MRTAIGVAAFATLTVAGLISAIAAVGANKQSVREATIQMERLATKLEHAKKITPETRLEIDRLTRHSWYDCNQVACRAAIKVRNRAARERLASVLAGSKAPIELSARREKSGSEAKQ